MPPPFWTYLVLNFDLLSLILSKVAEPPIIHPNPLKNPFEKMSSVTLTFEPTVFSMSSLSSVYLLAINHDLALFESPPTQEIQNQTNGRSVGCTHTPLANPVTELSTGWVDPWVGSRFLAFWWVSLGRGSKNVHKFLSSLYYYYYVCYLY